MKQTAVEWLVDESMKLVAQVMVGTLNEDTIEDDVYRILTKAKAMEKDQIVDFAYVIADDLACGVYRDKKSMEERYNEFLTFRSEEDDNIQ
jgi:hypothetical protein